MKPNLLIKILLGLAALILLIDVITFVAMGPWAGKKIRTALIGKNKDYTVDIAKTHVWLIPSGIYLAGISMKPRTEAIGKGNLIGEIASVKIKGIKLWKALVRKDIDIREITISNTRITGTIPESNGTKKPIILPVNLRIGKLVLNQTNLTIAGDSSAQSFSLTDGTLKVFDLQAAKRDTVSPALIRQFDFTADEIVSVSSDSLFTYSVSRINYKTAVKTLSVNNFSIHPNYTDYDFAAKHPHQSDRIEAGFSKVSMHDFAAAEFLVSRNVVSSYIEIGKMDLSVFRDKRKPFRHVIKPVFQEMIQNYQGLIHIDSIGVIKGNVVYREHAEGANDAGSISFMEIHAGIYKITNNPASKSEKPSMELKGEALLMGKARMTILLKAEVFDPSHLFTLSGTLSGMDARELNPILENSAFIQAKSGKIDAMDFSFSANDTKSTGKMTLLYHDLEIAMINKQTDKTTAFKERFMSFLANMKLLDSNPLPNKEVREGIIGFDRDSERFLFNYAFKSILSGITSSLAKRQDSRTRE